MEIKAVKCRKCGGDTFIHEIEVMNIFVEIGAFCQTPTCDLFQVLLV